MNRLRSWKIEAERGNGEVNEQAPFPRRSKQKEGREK